MPSESATYLSFYLNLLKLRLHYVFFLPVTSRLRTIKVIVASIQCRLTLYLPSVKRYSIG
jgi:hypothetical protein